MRSLIVLFSYHHNNTEKIARVMAEVFGAEIKHPGEVNVDEVQDYELVGFGSGIYGDKHHKKLLDLVDSMEQASGKKAFIFSTSGITGKSKVKTDHSALRDKLISKGYSVVDEFQCLGFNTNSFLKYFGGMNKKRPNRDDLLNAEKFAQKLLSNSE